MLFTVLCVWCICVFSRNTTDRSWSATMADAHTHASLGSFALPPLKHKNAQVEQFLASLFPERPTRRSQSPPLSCTAYNGDSGGGGPPTWWPSPAGRDEKVSDNGLPHLRAVQPAAAATAPPQLDVQECEWSDAADGGSSYVASTHFKAQLAGSVAPVLAASGDSDDLGGDMGDAADVPASLAGGASASGMAAGVLQDSGSLEELRRGAWAGWRQTRGRARVCMRCDCPLVFASNPPPPCT